MSNSCPKCHHETPEWGWDAPDEWTCPECGTVCDVEQDSSYSEEAGSWCWYILTEKKP